MHLTLESAEDSSHSSSTWALNGDLKAFRCCCRHLAQSIQFNMDTIAWNLNDSEYIKWLSILSRDWNFRLFVTGDRLIYGWSMGYVCVCQCEGVCTVLVVLVSTWHLCVSAVGVMGYGVTGWRDVWGSFTRGLINVGNVPGICFFSPLFAGFI